jgi:hypothetical protein
MQVEALAILIWVVLTACNVGALVYMIKLNMERKAHQKQILEMDLQWLREEHRKVKTSK